MYKEIVILIPAYEPEKNLLEVIEGIKALGSFQFVVVDDGSSKEAQLIFQTLRESENVTVLVHGKNLGKGQALKTGINHILVAIPNALGIVTADADGQHLPKDIASVSQALKQKPHSLVMGTRTFPAETPLRSRIGNVVTSKLFSLFMRCNISDTQTGLRGIPANYAKELLSIDSSGYEFEFEVLVAACKQHRQISTVPIETVYLDGNIRSHFSPIVDSLKIYFVFSRFIASSLLVSVIDMIAFSIAFFFFGHLLSSMVAGRICAGTSQFLLSKYFVFNSPRKGIWELLRYCTFVAVLTGI